MLSYTCASCCLEGAKETSFCMCNITTIRTVIQNMSVATQVLQRDRVCGQIYVILLKNDGSTGYFIVR